MIKKIIMFTAAALILSGCVKDDMEACSASGNGELVSVAINVAEYMFDTETGYEPMTRAGSASMLLKGDYLIVIMKQVEGYWVVDRTFYPKFDGIGQWSTKKITGSLPDSNLNVDLTPGEYTAMACLNVRDYNVDTDMLVSGTVVKQVGTETQVPAPMFLTYSISTGQGSDWSVPQGGINARTELFSGNTQFTVTKGDNLHNTYVPVEITIPVTRKSGKLQFYGRETALSYFQTEGNSLKWDYVMTANTSKPFADGIDLWGDVYFNTDNPRTSLMTSSWWHYEEAKTRTVTREEGGENVDIRYKYFSSECTSYNPFMIADPRDSEGVPYTLSIISATEQNGLPSALCYETFDKVLVCNQMEAISLVTDVINGSGNLIFVGERDENNNLVDVTDMLPPDTEYDDL